MGRACTLTGQVKWNTLAHNECIVGFTLQDTVLLSVCFVKFEILLRGEDTLALSFLHVMK